MKKVDVFSTRLITIEKIFDDKELINVLNVVKKDTENLSAVMQGRNGPTYRTNFFVANVNGNEFVPLIEKLNSHLNEHSLEFNVTEPPWYSEYGEYDQHGPHIHDQQQIDLMGVQGAFKYSGIINLSNFGETMFINPNPSSFSKMEMRIPSTYGEVILFPSNIWHYVAPHGLRNKTRATFAFNGLLRGLDNE